MIPSCNHVERLDAVRLARGGATLALALLLTLAWLVGLPALRSAQAAPVRVDGPDQVYLPFILGPPAVSPTGAYACEEFEYGVRWRDYFVELRPDGTSVYTYTGAHAGVATGTWVYTPFDQTIGFSHFHWLTATYTSPNRIRAELRLEPGPGSPMLEMWCWRP